MKIDSKHCYTQTAFCKKVGLKNRQYINALIKKNKLEKAYPGAKQVEIQGDVHIIYYPIQETQ